MYLQSGVFVGEVVGHVGQGQAVAEVVKSHLGSTLQHPKKSNFLNPGY